MMDDTNNAVLFNINQTYQEGMPEEELYLATRHAWKLNKNRLKDIEFALGVSYESVKSIYKIDSWQPAREALTKEEKEIRENWGRPEKDIEERWAFQGEPASQEIKAKFLNQDVSHLTESFKQGNVLRYINLDEVFKKGDSEMNYWHMQMHPDDKNWGKEKEVLNNGFIGLGEWNEEKSQQSQFENEMQKGDIVAIRNGATPIALVKINGEHYYEKDTKDFDWIVNRRNVIILDFYKKEYDFRFSAPMGTLSRCADLKNDTSKLIIDWYKKIKKNNPMQEKITLLESKHQIILQGPPGTGKTYTAKDLAAKMILGKVIDDKKEQKKKLDESGQFHLIQFHPAYSYEDFVRGIVAETEDGQVSYKVQNKILAEFAEKALENWKAYHDYNEDKTKFSKKEKIKEIVEEFKEYIRDELENPHSENLNIGTNVEIYINEVKEDGFGYGKDWKTSRKIKFEYLNQALLSSTPIDNSNDFKSMPDIKKKSEAYFHASYYYQILKKIQEKYQDELNKIKSDNNDEVKKPELKPHILIIDEINRANLPAVLGELIYALEYRGEGVDSMYAIDNDRKIILPENLYIIGTMNTADRSVGHIDYAIRRRFAFVEMLPDANIIENEKGKKLFHEVETLFNEQYLSSEFKKEDVQIGHSYFMAKTEDELKQKLKYEIKPILREYLKDGILIRRGKR